MLDYLKRAFRRVTRFNAFKAGQAVTNTVLDKLSSLRDSEVVTVLERCLHLSW